jgi:HEAT repeats
VADLIAGLAQRIGVPAFVAVCTDLMGGADREQYVEELRSLTGHDWHPGDGVFDRDVWHDYWVRTWGARGLLHVWDDSATAAVVTGLADEHWRPAEMCLKVTAKHDVAGAGDAAAALVTHELPRVRAQALRALAVAGDTQHVDLVRDRLEDDDEAVRRQAERALEQMARRMDVGRDLGFPGW